MGQSVWDEMTPAGLPVAFGSSLENTNKQMHRMRAWTFFPIVGGEAAVLYYKVVPLSLLILCLSWHSIIPSLCLQLRA